MRNPFFGRRLQYVRLFLLSMTLVCALYSQTRSELRALPPSDSDPKVILEVINYHFTMGRKIPSIYLRLFSDGTAECHTLKFSGQEQDAVKKEHLEPEEFAAVRAILNQPELRGVKSRYDHPRTVVDSWMEWQLRAPDSQLRRDVTISFGPSTQHVGASVEALGNLGCQILKIREYVFGDRTDYYGPACVSHSPKPERRC